MRALLALPAVVLAGCASLTEAQCNGSPSEWTALGAYDAVQGDQPWIEAYARVCERRYGATVKHDDYMKGWDAGHAEFNRRVDFD